MLPPEWGSPIWLQPHRATPSKLSGSLPSGIRSCPHLAGKPQLIFQTQVQGLLLLRAAHHLASPGREVRVLIAGASPSPPGPGLQGKGLTPSLPSTPSRVQTQLGRCWRPRGQAEPAPGTGGQVPISTPQPQADGVCPSRCPTCHPRAGPGLPLLLAPLPASSPAASPGRGDSWPMPHPRAPPWTAPFLGRDPCVWYNQGAC